MNWKILRKGDIIQDSNDSCWENSQFKILDFFGNSYCPMIYVKFLNKNKFVNLVANKTKLINSSYRPLYNIKKKILIKLSLKGNIEAQREIAIRVNQKNF